MTPSQSPMATDGALKLNYESVVFVDPGVQIDDCVIANFPESVPVKLNLILLSQLLCAIHKVSGSLHLSKTMA